MILRRHYRGCLKEGTAEKIASLLQEDNQNVKEAILKEECLTVALYREGNMLFLYYEVATEKLRPEDLFPTLSKHLELWPEMDGKVSWSLMYNIYYHAVPESISTWERQGKKRRRGRIALLLPDKLFSYTYYHKAIVDEGLLEGDKYQSIALHGNLLFSYFEEPKIMTHIKNESKEESKVIEEWLAADPESHFDHEFSGKGNFKFIEELFSMGREDIKNGEYL